MVVAVARFETVTGTVERTPVPLPSCPSAFRPQHLTVESLNRAQVWARPAESEVAVVIPETSTGVAELTVDPLPSCPSA